MHEKTGIGLAPLAAQRKMAHPPFLFADNACLRHGRRRMACR
nr:hypothetical protein [uncultured Ottowia sp.]